ncbi:polyphosphate polymerase domain-containing protein [Leucobacter soli]|uniref:VTC domain-containing protein n=1 Tax=Leucobacter soli TaxID=2812850 RepID=A0A916NNC6_9MICO|nr:polyphosphate polymerase domain-containing protein [Leucobacter soli]CAG7606771.1 hypothetical protein LEUCIP111803_00968 [Leucobacter soli]
MTAAATAPIELPQPSAAMDPAGHPGSELPLGGFAPVGLDELVSEAELLTRVDRKYLVPIEEAAAILSRIDPRSRVLEIGGSRDFGYDSVYFDTPDHLSYRLTAQRRRRRFKLRTRSYLDTGSAYLELKTKSGRGATVKDRIPVDPADRTALSAEGRAYVSTMLGAHGHDPALVDALRPALVSRYRRATLLLRCGSRATFDTRLRWRDGSRRVALPGHAIIESKSAGRPSELDRALWRAGHRPSGISKFGTGTAALHPELPGNKWARVLRDPFDTASRSEHAS